MSLLGSAIYLVLRIFVLILIARIVIEMIQSFSRNFQPPRWFIYIAEPLFVITDPPVKALRRVIPPLKLGGVALDMSVIVLFIILSVLQVIVLSVFGA
ncbi:YggT family protein [Corynebacterium sp.]|uniref:YggT family protein n=1 Tax=Corynebacterium sp. TaxID=1720 RepID=UPI001996A7DD|nr:YggT family protein [Corynebacterium sp.]HHU66702.1 YggT family protein [Corynebacterium sp.]HKM25402.1 YggT family protein [Corynebacterium sp.]